MAQGRVDPKIVAEQEARDAGGEVLRIAMVLIASVAASLISGCTEDKCAKIQNMWEQGRCYNPSDPRYMSEVERIQEEVRAQLLDPDSVRFGMLTISGHAACIGVNAHNAFGGYTGETQVVLLKDNDGVWHYWAPRERDSHAGCISFVRNGL